MTRSRTLAPLKYAPIASGIYADEFKRACESSTDREGSGTSSDWPPGGALVCTVRRSHAPPIHVGSGCAGTECRELLPALFAGCRLGIGRYLGQRPGDGGGGGFQ